VCIFEIEICIVAFLKMYNGMILIRIIYQVWSIFWILDDYLLLYLLICYALAINQNIICLIYCVIYNMLIWLLFRIVFTVYRRLVLYR